MADVSFLFWNVNGKPLEDRIAQLCLELDVDIVLLAESTAANDSLHDAFDRLTKGAYVEAEAVNPSHRLAVWSRLGGFRILPVFEDNSQRLTVLRVVVEDAREILLAVVHFHSRVNWTGGDQTLECTTLANEISRIENELGHRRTVLVGDLNMNPFDEGVVASHGLHAVMTAAIAARESRTVAGREYPFFYNPMWGHFGDRTNGPAGTHYFDKGNPITYFWNIYDQVLLRPELVKSLVDLRIVDRVGKKSLLTRHGRPSGTLGSDHLPLFFRLKLGIGD